MAKEHAEAALETLRDVLQHGDSESARVTAAIAILDRAYGKPPQSMELTGADGGPVEVARIERYVVDAEQVIAAHSIEKEEHASH